MPDWMEISVPATVASADDVAALLADGIPAAASGVEIRGDEVIFWVPMDEYESVLAHTRRLTRHMAPEWGVDPQGITAQPAVPESEWRDAWKRYFHVTRVTRRLTIVPSWETHTPSAPGEIALDLDPGQAFGTGAHASTRLLLQELDELQARGHAVTRFLDLGTGSGILAIAAAKLWPESRGLAVDIEPMAVDAARENSARNQVGDRIEHATTPIREVTGTFDLLMANIQSSVLLDLADDICARVAPGGVLLLSGLLTEQARDLAAAYGQRPGIEIDSVRQSDHDPEWSCVHSSRA